MAKKYMAANANSYLITVSNPDWTLTELAQGKKYEPPPEPVTPEIKVATTEFPPVVVKQPDPKVVAQLVICVLKAQTTEVVVDIGWMMNVRIVYLSAR